MPESYRSRSALAHRGLKAGTAGDADTGITLAELPLRVQVTLRGDAADPAFAEAVSLAVDIAPPQEPNTVAGPIRLSDGPRALWLGPDEWLIVSDETEGLNLPAALRGAIGEQHAAVVDVSDGRTVIALSGPNARDVLAKGCPVDMHERAFPPGRCAQTHLAKAHVILHYVDPAPIFEIYVHRSFADYLWSWLLDAADEYGVSIAGF